jgi:hypothetical protein
VIKLDTDENTKIQSIGILIELSDKNTPKKTTKNPHTEFVSHKDPITNKKIAIGHHKILIPTGSTGGGSLPDSKNLTCMTERYYHEKRSEVYKLSDNRIKVMKGKFLYDLQTCQYVADPSGWWVSEKLDGIRAIWTGAQLISRTGHVIDAPKWFLLDLPSRIALDGELYLGRNCFHETQSVVMQKGFSSDKRWMKIRYHVFDIPDARGLDFEEVQIILNESPVISESKYIQVIKQNRIKDLDELLVIQRDLVKSGAEGTMLRKPGSKYRIGETYNLLKFKTNFNRESSDESMDNQNAFNNDKDSDDHDQMVHLMDDLAVIIGYKYNYDKMKSDGRTPTIKSILVKWCDVNKFPMNPEFHVSHHITQTQKMGDYETLFPVGQKVKILYNQLFTSSQKPRFPRYAGWVLDQ